LAGCSKKEETLPPPPATAPVAATPKAQDISAPIVSAAQQAATNVTAAVAAATNTALQAANNVLSSSPVPVSLPASVPTSVPGFAPSAAAAPAPPADSVPAAVTSTPGLSLASLSTDQVTQGLKEALGKGLKQAVSSLGQPGGFLSNMNVRIPMPDKMQTVEKTLRALGQGAVADQFVTTMNQAAEQAVPVAADVFVDAMKNMSVDDAKGILNGPPDAATQYFRRTTQADLSAKFTPIVQQAMSKTGATAAYEQVMDKAKSASPFFKSPTFDLNAYVTGKALDGLFKIVADEEKNIRSNPVARSTDVLKSVFGSLTK